MSRTKKGSKSPGYEYWGKRALSIECPGKETKKRTHKLERIRSKLETKKLKKKYET